MCEVRRSDPDFAGNRAFATNGNSRRALMKSVSTMGSVEGGMKPLILCVIMAFVGCKGTKTPSNEGTCIKNYPELQNIIQEMDIEITRLESQDNGQLQTVDDVVGKLANMHAVDQHIRHVYIPAKDDYKNDAIACFNDAINRRYVDVGLRYTVVLTSLIKEFGWPRIGTFGEDADHHAWLLAQHSDLDRAFQREVLSLLEPLALEGETDPINFAYLYDRLAMADNKPQRYGTQGRCTLDGGLNPIVLEDEENIDRIRASVGLPELEIAKISLEISCVERFRKNP